MCRDRGSARSPAQQASIPGWRGGTTAGITSHPISAEQARSEEGTARDSGQMAAGFGSPGDEPAAGHAAPTASRSGLSSPGTAAGGVPGAGGDRLAMGRGVGLACVRRRCAFVRAGTRSPAAAARGRGADTSSPGTRVRPRRPPAPACAGRRPEDPRRNLRQLMKKAPEKNVRKAMQKFIFYFNSKI